MKSTSKPNSGDVPVALQSPTSAPALETRWPAAPPVVLPPPPRVSTRRKLLYGVLVGTPVMFGTWVWLVFVWPPALLGVFALLIFVPWALGGPAAEFYRTVIDWADDRDEERRDRDASKRWAR